MEAVISALSILVHVISAKEATVLLLVIQESRKIAFEPPFLLMFTKCDLIPFAVSST